MSQPTGPRVSVSRRQPTRVKQSRRRLFLEALEERRVLAVTWDVQSDYFGERDVVSQARSLRGLALSGDDAHVLTGFIQGSTSSGVREVSSALNSNLIGNGGPGAAHPSNPVYSVGLETSLFMGSSIQPRGLAGDERGYFVASLSTSGNSSFQSWAIYSEDLAVVATKSSQNFTASSTITGISTVKIGTDYFAYVGWRNGQIERWNVNNPALPVLDTDWGSLIAPGTITLKSVNGAAYMNGMEVDTDGTIFVAGSLNGGNGSSGNALIKIPAAAAAAGNVNSSTVTSVAVEGGANNTAAVFGAMDVALYAGKAYVTQYLALNSTISAFYTLDLSSAGKITPPIGSLVGPSGKVSEYNSDAGPDSGFSGIDISADGKIYLAEQLYNFTPAAGSYTPPGGNPITGTRIYFDRVLVSTALDVEGPVTTDALVDPNPATAGGATQVTLTANINDTSTSGSTIAAAEYSVNGGADWTLMNAVDGVFDEVTEAVTVTFSLASASFSSPGSYEILVRGIDTAAQAGAAVTVTLEVEGLAPSITSVDSTTFTVGIPGTFNVTTTADPTAAIDFTGTLPSGVDLIDNGDGTATLSGTPSVGTQGSYALTITASNGVAPDATQSFTLFVNPPPVDYGDAPDSYGTLLASDGARHAATGPTLGATRDIEADGQPSIAADGDGADEDGITMSSTLYARVGAAITVNAPTGGRLDAWIDYNRNGAFDANEQIADGLILVSGDTTFSIEVPKGILAGPSYARFRVSSSGGLGPTGPAANGEVEDHAITLAVPTPGSAVVVDDPLNPGQGVLILQGTDYFYETISVQPTAGQPGKVTASVSTGTTVAGIDLASFGRILIFAEGGFDSITIGSAITKPSTIYGDAGFDIINGGGGADTIFGGADYDSLSGNGGDDTFVSEVGADYINGGAGFDTIVKFGSGNFNLSNYLLSVGSTYVSISSIENAQLNGGAGADVFTLAGWTGSTFINGGAGSNTLNDSADANYVLEPGFLTRTVGSTTSIVAFSGIDNVNLTGGFGNNTFDLSAWPLQAVVNGGYYGTDTLILSGNVDFNLTNAIVHRPALGMVRVSGIDNAVITGGAAGNTFNIVNWSAAATLNGAGGDDKVVAAGNANFTLSDTLLTRSVGGPIALNSVEQAEITGGANDNTINGAAFSGTLKFDGAGGNDTLTAGSGAAILLGGTGNDTLNAGSGRAFMIGGLGLDRITGGTNSDLIIDGRTTSDDNAAALAHILADWLSAQTYDQRADHVIADHLGGANVIHDEFIDILLGGGDDDLFFAKLDTPFLDSIGDLAGIERSI